MCGFPPVRPPTASVQWVFCVSGVQLEARTCAPIHLFTRCRGDRGDYLRRTADTFCGRWRGVTPLIRTTSGPIGGIGIDPHPVGFGCQRHYHGDGIWDGPC